jgi:hypothetical protein
MPSAKRRARDAERQRLGLPSMMGRPPRGVVLTPAGYILMDGTPYDPLVRKLENERSKAAKRRKQPKGAERRLQ